MDLNNKYTKMQQSQYDEHASSWTPEDRDHVVGAFDQHNKWKDYDDFLFKNIDTKDKVALDFGCGPGRNIVKFANSFKQIDGTDISDINLSNAKKWCVYNNLTITPTLYKSNGIDISNILSDNYDIIFSTICMQHICVNEIRFNLFKEFFRVLKSGGAICKQMGFGDGHPRTVGYYENNYDAIGTNSLCDTRVNDPNELKSDLEKIGFINFEYDIRPVGPGDGHNNWIFFRAFKP
jgi:SAM-dependent methyltransferase